MQTLLMSENKIRNIVYASLLAALTAVGAYISIPIPVSPVPIVLQNFFILLAGLLLGSRMGVMSVLLYLIIGALGVPVFAGGTGGFAHFLAPSGGYLIGYVPAVFVVGLIAERGTSSFLKDIIAAAVGALIVYAAGVPFLKVVASFTWQKAIISGVVPFLIGDALKIVGAAAAVKIVRPIIKEQATGTYNDQ